MKDAFANAKDALQLVGRFGTPPTPEVFEVWFRFVEGADEALLAQLNHAVNEAESVTVEMLNSLHEQFCTDADDTQCNVAEALTSELERIQSLISTQKAAGTEFDDSIVAASDVLSHATESALADGIAELSKESKKMRLQLAKMEKQLTQSQDQISSLQDELAVSQRGMMTDHLTGIGNRRFFDTFVHRTITESNHSVDLIYLALIDLDRFKLINDTFGHDAGDQIIRFVASQISELRPDVTLARLGGDEFACFLCVAERENALQFTDQLRDHFASQQLQLKKTQEAVGKLTLSIGAALLRSTDDATSWYERADSLLYQAKDLGRNRAVVENRT